MKRNISTSPLSSERGSILVYVVLSLLVFIVIASVVMSLNTHGTLAGKRRDMERAYQFASGGAAIATSDLNRAFASTLTDIGNALVSDANFPYAHSLDLSTTAESCYTRTISAPFENQLVFAQIWLSLAETGIARVASSATTNGVTQEITSRIAVSYGFGAAITSTHAGNGDTGDGKSSGQAGNVAISTNAANKTFVDGGILANGSVNHSSGFVPEADQISANLQSTEGQIPDYTNPGSPNQLFDFNRFIAVANVQGTHYADTTAFKTAIDADADHTLEGVIAVDIEDHAADWSPSRFPYGINIKGTLVLNFAPSWGATDKLKVDAALNINAADLTGLVPADPSTYTTGYPPVYSVATNNPISANITAVGFSNFAAEDDLPAIMYLTAILDFHGNVNICGVVYSSAFCEIENKGSGQIQYIKGSVIVGSGIYYENSSNAVSIISYDAQTVDRLSTSGSKGKTFKVVHLE